MWKIPVFVTLATPAAAYLRRRVDEVLAAPPEAGDGHGVRGERREAAARQRVPDAHVAVLRRAAQLPAHAVFGGETGCHLFEIQCL